MADEGFHEIQLSGKHLVALFMAATVVAVVIFLCGVIVGRDIYKQRVAMAQAASEAPVDPTAEARPPRAAEPTGSASTSSAPAGSSQEKLSYPDRLGTNAPPAESLKPAPPAPAPERVPAPPPPETADPVPARSAQGEPQGGGFAVQVAAVGERAEADTIARRLSNKGYPAYVMPPASGAPRVFRVRVGKFKERREAEQIAGRLQREEQFKPWITR